MVHINVKRNTVGLYALHSVHLFVHRLYVRTHRCIHRSKLFILFVSTGPYCYTCRTFCWTTRILSSLSHASLFS